MPQKPYDKNKLLEMNDALDVLTVFLLKGIKKGITFSEFEHVLKSKEKYPRGLFNNRAEITRDTLKNRLKQMVREGLVIQKKSKAPYFLMKKWYNLPIKIISKNIIEKSNINDIIIPSKSFDKSRNLRFNDIGVIFGLNLENLSEKHRRELKMKMNSIQLMTLELFELKHKIIDQESKRYLNSLYSSLNDEEKVVWNNIICKNPSFYENLINLSLSLIIIADGDVPNKLMVDVFFSNEPAFIRALKIRALKVLSRKLVDFYPFGVGLFSFYDMKEFDRDILSDNQIKQLLIARSKSRKNY